MGNSQSNEISDEYSKYIEEQKKNNRISEKSN